MFALKYLAPLAVAASLMTSVAQAEPLFVANSSFEETRFSDGGFVIGSVVGWEAASNAGSANPTASQFPSLPQDEHIAFVGSGCVGACFTGSLEQILDATLEEDTLYTLTVDVGWANGIPLTQFEVQLLSYDEGSDTFTELASGSLGEADFILGQGTFEELTLQYTSREISPAKLAIRFLSEFTTADYRQVSFDNVRVDATAVDPLPGEVPEPATLGLLGLGLASLGYARRRKA